MIVGLLARLQWGQSPSDVLNVGHARQFVKRNFSLRSSKKTLDKLFSCGISENQSGFLRQRSTSYQRIKPVPAGRPTILSAELADKICHRLSEGESLRSICRDEGMPDRTTVLRWQNNNAEFAAKCARAREAQADWLQDDMADIESDVLRGALDPQAARVVLSSKQWRASKLAPKKYGDRQSVEHSGPDGGPIQTVDLSKMSAADLDALEAIVSRAAKP